MYTQIYLSGFIACMIATTMLFHSKKIESHAIYHMAGILVALLWPISIAFILFATVCSYFGIEVIPKEDDHHDPWDLDSY